MLGKRFNPLHIFGLGCLLLGAALLLAGCAAAPAAPVGEHAPLRVVATTSIVGDVVAQVGGEWIALNVLLPVGSDPHNFEPTPQDIARVAEADVIFINGAGFEVFLAPLLESAGSQDRVVDLSAPLALLESADVDHVEEEGDPHVWTDPRNVIRWVQEIAGALSALDEEHALEFQANAERYQAELEALDAWIREQVAQIPPENRQMVTDHAVFGYFAAAYGFQQVGALIPGYSTLAAPSARELAALEDAIQSLGVTTLFVGNTVNPSLAERVAGDTGVELVFLYTGSLSAPDGEAPTYLDYMRYNTGAIVEALK